MIYAFFLTRVKTVQTTNLIDAITELTSRSLTINYIILETFFIIHNFLFIYLIYWLLFAYWWVLIGSIHKTWWYTATWRKSVKICMTTHGPSTSDLQSELIKLFICLFILVVQSILFSRTCASAGSIFL